VKIIFNTLALLFVLNLSAQEASSEKTFSKENAFIGGSLTFNYNTQGFLIGINPMYGYTIRKWVDVAAVFNFQYNSLQLDQVATNYIRERKTTQVGTGLSTRIYPIEFLFLQVQPELNLLTGKERITTISGTSQGKFNKLVPSMLVGAGMKRGFQSGRTFAYASILVDIINNSNSPYRSLATNPLGGLVQTVSGNIVPIYRAGINLSLADLKRKNK
jgi:hypothetical protein